MTYFYFIKKYVYSIIERVLKIQNCITKVNASFSVVLCFLGLWSHAQQYKFVMQISELHQHDLIPAFLQT